MVRSFPETEDRSFSNEDLKKARFDKTYIYNSLFYRCNLENARFSTLTKVTFESCNLKEAKFYKGSLSRFIHEDAFWSLVLATAGHPRKALSVLREAMTYIAHNKKELVLDQEALRYAIRKCGGTVDKKDLVILTYIKKQNGASASDKGLLSATGLSRRPLGARLQSLTSEIGLKTKQMGQAGKVIYYLPELIFE